jgi:hypothetical protein
MDNREASRCGLLRREEQIAVCDGRVGASRSQGCCRTASRSYWGGDGAADGPCGGRAGGGMDGWRLELGPVCRREQFGVVTVSKMAEV